jgi:hydroxymethylpyrimidine pyrophosphatase-like HAD family hydrolase
VPGLPLADAGPLLDRLAPALLFSDVDGTLVGRDGALLADLEGRPTLAAAEALVAAGRAGLEVVLVSGRTGEQLRETGRLVGVRHAIGELGTVMVRGRDIEVRWGEAPRDLGATPAEALERSGALAALLEGFAGRLEPHTPWHLGRRGTALLRGQVDVAEADALLAAGGFGWARLLDNGRLRHDYPHLGPGRSHAYHLLPAGVSKAGTAAAYLAERALSPAQAAAIGDGPADLELAGVVGVMFLVANGAWAAAAAPPDRPVVVTPSAAGQGWAEAVDALLARVPGGPPGRGPA